jgi:chlorite dismutase
MTEAVSPTVGLGVVHLFCKVTPLADAESISTAVQKAQADGDQVVTVAVLGHKADLAFMLLGPDLWRLRASQAAIQNAGLDVVDSYVSLTELSEYSQTVPDAMKQARLYPELPPEGKPAWCFYPMSKQRGDVHNWFTVDYDERKEMMYEHGASGRKFAGRILQLITGSTGLDDYEWGVTLFATAPDDLKEAVYTMRFDRASALYAEFGPFYTGMVAPVAEVLERLGVD